VTDPSTARYTHLGPFSGLVAAAKAVRPLFGQAPIAGPESRQRAKESFAFTIAYEQPRDIRSGRSWAADGVRGARFLGRLDSAQGPRDSSSNPWRVKGDCRASSPCMITVTSNSLVRRRSRTAPTVALAARRFPADLLWRPRLGQLQALRARASDPAWARRAVDEGVRSCPRAVCGKSARPVR
jgi:hypothetical protein